MNRRLASQIADLHFAPTEWAKSNLLSEGIQPSVIYVTGNTVVDALLWVLQDSKTAASDDISSVEKWLKQSIGNHEFVLVTGHPRESFGLGLSNICMAIRELAEQYGDLAWIYPVHLNPNVQEPVRKILSGLKNIYLLNPQPYAAFVWLMSRSKFILTDSGGIQEEAPSLGKYVLLMRNTTERPEGIAAGVVRLVGTGQIRNYKKLPRTTQ